MVNLNNNWFAAIRKICDSERGTILCVVAATGAKAIIQYKDTRLELLRVSDAKVRVELTAEMLPKLLVTEAEAQLLAELAAELLAEQATATRRRLLDTERAAVRNLGRWAGSGQFRTHGVVGR